MFCCMEVSKHKGSLEWGPPNIFEMIKKALENEEQFGKRRKYYFKQRNELD